MSIKPRKISGKISFPYQLVVSPFQKIASPFQNVSSWVADRLFGKARGNQRNAGQEEENQDEAGQENGNQGNAGQEGENQGNGNQENAGQIGGFVGQNGNQNGNRNPDWMERDNPEDYKESTQYTEREYRVSEPNGLSHDLSSVERIKQFTQKQPPLLNPVKLPKPVKVRSLMEGEVSAVYGSGKITAAVNNKALSISAEKILNNKEENSVERHKNPAVDIVKDQETQSESDSETRSDVKNPNIFTEVLKGPGVKELLSQFLRQRTPIVLKLTEIAFSDSIALFLVGTLFIIVHALLLFVLMKKNPNISKNSNVNTVLVIGRLFYSLSFYPVTATVGNKVGEIALNKMGCEAFLSIHIVTTKHKAIAIFVTVSLFVGKLVVNGFFVYLASGAVHGVARQPLKAIYKSLNAPSKEDEKDEQTKK